MSSFSGVHLALQALLTQQQALEVVGHNVANVNTEGYHRQEAVLRAGPTQGAVSLYSSTLSGQVGTGVILQSVRRYSLEFTDTRYRQEAAETSRWEIEKNYLSQLEAALAETSKDGLGTILDEFWSGWKAASTDPEDLTVRADLLEKAKDLANAFNNRVQSINDLRNDQNLSIIQRVNEVNELADQVARLNGEIGRYSSAGTQANDFLDEQDLYLDRLAEITGAKITYEDNGQVMVSIGGHVLVQGTSTHDLVAEPEATNYNLVDIYWSDGQPLMQANGVTTLTSGELAGLQHSRDVVSLEQINKLNTLAENLVDQVNTLHSSGYGLTDTVTYDPSGTPQVIGPNREFFTTSSPTYDPNNPALSITVNSELEDVSKIALSQTAVIPDPPPTVLTTGIEIATGDGSIAEAIFNLQNEAISFDDGTTTVTDTFNNYNTMRVADLGLSVNHSNTMFSQHTNLLTVLNEQRESVSGVNLDEEAANLVKYQQAYNAALRLMSIVDEMLDKVVNGLGLVGR